MNFAGDFECNGLFTSTIQKYWSGSLRPGASHVSDWPFSMDNHRALETAL
jgi:hypothetical protein